MDADTTPMHAYTGVSGMRIMHIAARHETCIFVLPTPPYVSLALWLLAFVTGVFVETIVILSIYMYLHTAISDLLVNIYYLSMLLGE